MISPFEMTFGRVMPLGDIGQAKEIPNFTGRQKAYYEWLRDKLATIHKAVAESKAETKVEDQRQYDKRHSAVAPTWKVGDEVLLLDNKIKAKSEKVLTHHPYSGPFYVSQLVKGKDDVGLAYRLIIEKKLQFITPLTAIVHCFTHRKQQK